jgi:hypothetical protein
MICRNSIAALAVLAALLAGSGAQGFDDAKYPDFKGKWERVGAPRWLAPGQKAPLTPEYQAVYAANLQDQAQGGVGDWPSSFCIPQGMPAMMNLYDAMEMVVTPEITYILISHVNDSYRRIYTDGRDWPAEADVEKTYAGYSIGKWVDDDGDGRYDALEIETRYFKGPRSFESTGLPLHHDNQSVIKERIYLDKADPNTLFDEITVFDHALTQPWTLKKKAVRDTGARPVWDSETCSEGNSLVRIGKDAYFQSADGYLMPMKKGQPAPDLRYFKPTGQ